MGARNSDGPQAVVNRLAEIVHRLFRTESADSSDHRNDRSRDAAASSYGSQQQQSRPPNHFPAGDTSLSLGLSRTRLPQVSIPIMVSILSGLLSTPCLRVADRSWCDPTVKGTAFRVHLLLGIASLGAPLRRHPGAERGHLCEVGGRWVRGLCRRPMVVFPLVSARSPWPPRRLNAFAWIMPMVVKKFRAIAHGTTPAIDRGIEIAAP